MIRASLALRCLGNRFLLAAPTVATLLGRVLSPTIRPSDLASLAADTVAVVPKLNVSHTVTILELFSRHEVRHEPLMLACMWKVFKADLPVVSRGDDEGSMEGFAMCTSTAFLIMCQRGFVHDPQLLAIALGRCVECVSHLPFNGIVDVYDGIRLFDRSFFSLVQVALHTEERASSPLQEASEESPFLYSSQPNIVDVLCTELESSLRSIVETKRDAPSSVSVVRLLQSFSVVGVMDSSTLSVLRRVIEPMTVTAEVLLNMLMYVHEIHTRIMDVLDHGGDDEWMRTERSALVLVLTDKLMAQADFATSRGCSTKLVLSFRRLFEKYPTLVDDAPRLWDAIRAIRVSHKDAVCQTGRKHRPAGALFENAYAVKVKPVMSDASEAEKHIPPQFKTWRGPAVRNHRHKGSATPRKMAFGTQRVSRNYIKEKRKKFAPAVCRMPQNSGKLKLGRRTKLRDAMLPRPAEVQEASKPPPRFLVPVHTGSKEVAPKLLPPLTNSSSIALSVWPSKPKRLVGGLKVPLAVQLEAYVRREYRLYHHEHGDCTHGDTLHIVGEAFSVLVEHFTEYRGILSFIKSEYDATFAEFSDEVKRLRSVNLENESDRSLRAMELVRQRETFTSIISNQQAQLKATQGLVHSLREQLSLYEDSNNVLQNELGLKEEECKMVTQKSIMFARCMVEEAARNAKFIESHRTDEREIGRLNVQVESLMEKLDDADQRFNALMKELLHSGAHRSARRAIDKMGTGEASTQPSIEADKTEEEQTNNTVIALQRRIDNLLLDYEILKRETTEAKERERPVTEISECIGKVASVGREHSCSAENMIPATTSTLIKLWLQEENLTECEIDAMDYLLPPGMFQKDPLAFLKACHPIRNLYMKKADVVNILRGFWDLRQLHRQESLRKYFLDWLLQKTGTQRAAQELGLNMLYVCQKNSDDPECRGMMLALRSFIPEDVILTWRKIIKDMEGMCRDIPENVDGNITTSVVVDTLRVLMPEKSDVHMLQLRFYLWRLSKGSGKIPVDVLFDNDGHFVYLLKKQLLYEVEEFTLQVVEAIRSASGGSREMRIHDVANIILAQDKGISKGMLQRLVAEAAQITAIDLATADVNYTVKIQSILDRFRSSVMLRRVTPSNENTTPSNPVQFHGAAFTGNNETIV